MWRGEAQGLLDRLMIPSRSRAANSAFAAASFSVSSRRKGEAMGGPLVSKWCLLYDAWSEYFNLHPALLHLELFGTFYNNFFLFELLIFLIPAILLLAVEYPGTKRI